MLVAFNGSAPFGVGLASGGAEFEFVMAQDWAGIHDGSFRADAAIDDDEGHVDVADGFVKDATGVA